MVDLDSDPTKLIEIVEIGKQLLITRGALTTFSIANDVAKYFAIIPAMFAGVYPGLDDAQRHAAARARSRRSSRPSSSTRSSSSRSIPLALRGVALHARAARPRCCAATCSSTASAASSRRSSASSSSTCSSQLLPGIVRDAQPSPPWLAQHLAALRALLVLTVVLGVAYPLAVTAVGRLPGLSGKADGSLVRADGAPRSAARCSASRSPTPTAPRCRSASSHGRRRPATATTRCATGASNLGPEDVVDTLRTRCQARRPASLLTWCARRSAAVGALEGVDGARPYCTARAGTSGRVLAVCPRRRPDRCGDRSVVSVNQPCPAHPFVAALRTASPSRARRRGRVRSRRHVVRRSAGRRRPTPAVPADAVTASAQRPRPAHQPGVRRPAGRRGSPAPAASRRAAVRALVAEHTDRPRLGLPRRPRGQRARGEPRPRPHRPPYRDRRSGRHRRDWGGDHRATGELRVYLGAAPGVGKTYRMLEEGHRRAERGTDVVVGFVETARPRAHRSARRGPRGRAAPHDRAPRARRSPRWTSTPCSPGAPRSRSSTSSPTRTSRARGTPSAGRTSSDLLDAGITVVTTLNVQHLESLNDVVGQITGVAAARDGPRRRRPRAPSRSSSST